MFDIINWLFGWGTFSIRYIPAGYGADTRNTFHGHHSERVFLASGEPSAAVTVILTDSSLAVTRSLGRRTNGDCGGGDSSLDELLINFSKPESSLYTRWNSESSSNEYLRQRGLSPAGWLFPAAFSTPGAPWCTSVSDLRSLPVYHQVWLIHPLGYLQCLCHKTSTRHTPCC